MSGAAADAGCFHDSLEIVGTFSDGLEDVETTGQGASSLRHGRG